MKRTTEKSSPTRSEIMRAVCSKNTKPEMIVRRFLHGLGYRFRLHRKDLPGNPDMVFPGRRKIIFIHGCFWHKHDCKRGSRAPKNNANYWATKIARNVRRDEINRGELIDLGWQVLTVWECETPPSKFHDLRDRLVAFLG